MYGQKGPLTEKPDGITDGPVKNLLKQIIKGVEKEPAAPIIIKTEPSTSGIKKEKKKSQTSHPTQTV